jgi:hypothetical protein
VVFSADAVGGAAGVTGAAALGSSFFSWLAATLAAVDGAGVVGEAGAVGTAGLAASLFSAGGAGGADAAVAGSALLPSGLGGTGGGVMSSVAVVRGIGSTLTVLFSAESGTDDGASAVSLTLGVPGFAELRLSVVVLLVVPELFSSVVAASLLFVSEGASFVTGFLVVLEVLALDLLLVLLVDLLDFDLAAIVTSLPLAPSLPF